MNATTSTGNASEETPAVRIVVVNWNNHEDTTSCVRSLEALEYANYEVVIVDNGSTDGSAERLAETFADTDWCELVRNDSNRGFGGGVNAGIDTALAQGAEFVFLLNNDARPEPGCLRELVDVAGSSDADVVGASIVDGTGSRVNPVPNRHPDMFFFSGYRGRVPFFSDEPPVETRWWSTDRVEGAGALLSRELLEERRETVGYFLDESLFMYCEEVELAIWCREHDKESVIAADAIVRHEGGASSSRAFQLYYLTRNRILIAHRYFGVGERLVFDIAYPVTRLLRSARYLKQGNRNVARGIIEGLIDGYRHRDGQTW